MSLLLIVSNFYNFSKEISLRYILIFLLYSNVLLLALLRNYYLIFLSIKVYSSAHLIKYFSSSLISSNMFDYIFFLFFISSYFIISYTFFIYTISNL